MASGPSRLLLAERFISYLGRSDIQPAMNMLSPVAVYQVLAHHSLSGTFSTSDEIGNHLLTLAERTAATLEATKFEDWLIGEQHVAGVARVQLQAEGQLYSGRQIYLLRFDSADLIDKVTVFFEDAAAATRFFRK